MQNSRIGSKIKIKKKCTNRIYNNFKVVLCKKPLDKTPNSPEKRRYWKSAILQSFRILAVFLAVFCIEQLQCVVKTVLPCSFAFPIFDPKWGFCKGYSLCLVAIFGNFQNGLIFRILVVFSSLFLHRTTAMFCTNGFSMFSSILNFWPKVRILQRL